MTRTRIKFCGITRPADAELCAALGVDAVGLNFYPKSPRYISAELAVQLVKLLGPFVCPVGLFVNALPFHMQSIAQYTGLRALQSYSDAPLRIGFGYLGWIPAFRVKDESGIDDVKAFLELCSAKPAAVVLDSFVPGEMGGTGHVAPWHLLAGLNLSRPIILAGGLTPDNVGEAICQVRPWGVDVASGIESAPGHKDAGKMRAFVEAVREADAN